MSNVDTTKEGRLIEAPLLLLTGRSEAVTNSPLLSLRQEMFCEYMVQIGDTFDNATLSYAEAYNFDLASMSRDPVYASDGITKLQESEYHNAYDYCSRAGWRLRRSEKINNRIRQLLNELKRNEVVDAVLMQIILNGKKDSDRISAAKEYNALEQRITKKLDLTTKGESLNVEDKSKIEKALEGVL